MVEAHTLEKKIWPSDDSVGARFPIFTRANTGEVFTVASTPFTWSLFGRVDYEGGFRDALIRMGTFVAEDFGPEGHGRCVCVASFGGYVYISVSISRILGVRAPGMSPEAIDQSFFGDHPDVTPYRAHPDDETLGAGGLIVLYVVTQNIRFVGIGLMIAVGGYALEIAGAMRERNAASA